MKTIRRSYTQTSARASLLTALALAALFLRAPAVPANAQTAPRYAITELQGVPQKLNNNGQIAGWVFVGADAHAAIYSNGVWRDLGVPAGDQLSALFGISDAGAAVGFSFASLPGPDNRWQAIWAPAGAASVQALSALAPDSFAYGVNNSGAIVGCLNRYDDVFPDPHRAFLYANGIVTDLHALLTTDPIFDFSCARDINNDGVVVGEVQRSSTPKRGFMYRDGIASRLESGTSYLTNARAVNDAGLIVGEGRLAGFVSDHALVYSAVTGAVTSLGLETTAAFNSRPNDVNTQGEVVGMMFLPLVGEHAFLASQGQVLDLNDLIPAGSDWVLQEAHSINDRGQIVGKGYLTSSPTVTRYFLLQAYGMVIAWGDNLYGQSSVPAGLDNVSAIAGGGFHSLALKSDGTAVAWGRNDFGQAAVPAGLNGVTAIAGGGFHSLALKSDGTVTAWGRNDFGQATIPAGLNGVIAIAGGGFHSLALKSDGTVVAWGADGNGQSTIPAGLSGVIAIDAGGGHSLALKSDGTVVAWGANFSGQSTIPAGLSGVIAIDAGGSHSLALKSDGTMAAWGDNSFEQSSIPAGLSGVIAIDAGGSHSLALKSDGTVAAWGYNDFGQSTIPAGLNSVFAIAAGGIHNLALVPPDTTAPVITSNVVGTLGSNGWYVSDVTVSWSVVDNESPISSQTGCDSVTLTADTAGATLTCEASSAGGTNSQSVTIQRDATAPTITFADRTAPNANGWNNTDVTVNWNCSDGLSGPTTVSVSQTLSSEGVNQSTTGTCADLAGNSASDTQSGINIDKIAPTVDAGPDVTIIQGNTFMGAGTFSDPGPATWTATVDYGDGSDMQSLALTGNTFTLNHVYTTAGIFTLEVVITDAAGNVGTATIVVTVLAPREGIAGLIEQVQALVPGSLNRGQGNALTAKLEAAIRQLDRGNIATAINQLESFLNQVNALIRSGSLSPTEGQSLLDAANAILIALGG
jgi:probable HAF family extracellular repeat protein